MKNLITVAEYPPSQITERYIRIRDLKKACIICQQFFCVIFRHITSVISWNWNTANAHCKKIAAVATVSTNSRNSAAKT